VLSSNGSEIALDDEYDGTMVEALLIAMSFQGHTRKIREHAGYSVAEVAAGIGVSRVIVNQWEKLEKTPRGDNAFKYAVALLALAEISEGRPPEGHLHRALRPRREELDERQVDTCGCGATRDRKVASGRVRYGPWVPSATASANGNGTGDETPTGEASP
jgi:transcriptional regulator with XRE-family HTH domain